MRLAALALALLSGIAHAGDPWDTGDKVIGTVAASMIIRDWGQTRYIAKHPEAFIENNPILGDHPSVGKVDRYFVGYLAATYFIADWMSPHSRKAFLMGVSIVELVATEKNKRIGVKFEF